MNSQKTRHLVMFVTFAFQEDDSNLMHEDKPTLDWGNLQGLIDELEGESGLSKLIEMLGRWNCGRSF